VAISIVWRDIAVQYTAITQKPAIASVTGHDTAAGLPAAVTGSA